MKNWLAALGAVGLVLPSVAWSQQFPPAPSPQTIEAGELNARIVNYERGIKNSEANIVALRELEAADKATLARLPPSSSAPRAKK